MTTLSVNFKYFGVYNATQLCLAETVSAIMEMLP